MPISTVIDNAGQVPIKIWTDDIEPEAIAQLENTASLPFVFKHVAAMPDVHAGMGATIGSVVATRGAVCPATVGVDLGCFSGDTKVPLLDGTVETLKNLWTLGLEFWVYSIDIQDGKNQIVAGQATAQKTRFNEKLLEVTISGGEKIYCTLDHKFLLRSGEYQEAQYLKPNDSLMPLYRSYEVRDGYERIHNPGGNSVQTYKQIYETSFGKIPSGHIVHHKNHNKHDNTPDNLGLLTPGQHSSHHRKMDGTPFTDPIFIKNRKEKLDREGYFAPHLLEKKKEVGVQNITKYMKERPKHFRKSVAGNGQRGKKYLVAYNQSEKGRAKSKEVSNALYDCGICSAKIKIPSGIAAHRRKEHNNHKVVSVRVTNRVEDVYCLQVDKYHNFALAAGVFVHNCGMIATKVKGLKGVESLGNLTHLRHSIERSIPVGFDGNTDKNQTETAKNWVGWGQWEKLSPLSQKHDQRKAVLQLGSLGGGNHFCEFCLDTTTQDVWIVLHSGSRGIGNKIAQGHIEKAKGIMKQMFISLPDPDLAYFATGTSEFKEYMNDLLWAQDYALENREEMMRRVLRDLMFHLKLNSPLGVETKINCHHNFAVFENHFGSNVVVTRKGAIRARVGDFGVIPGSMGTRSYIVKGLGNEDSFTSCSHGAGRKMSRTKARNIFTVEDMKAQTEGVECRKDKEVIDEIPGAYKKIEDVMANQKDLVEIVAEIKQVLCVKG